MPLDPNNQNYFSLGEQPVAPLPWWKVRRYQIQLAVIAAVIVGVGVVGYYAYQTYTLTYVNGDALNQANTIIDAAAQACADEEDPAACEAAARADAARATGEASVCRGLEDAELANCVSLIANDSGNPSLCGMLSVDAETACVNGATLVAAKRAKDYGECGGITDMVLKHGCQNQLLGEVIANGECEKYGIDASTCDFPGLLNDVVANGDVSGCLQFSGEQRETCNDVFSSVDQDGDGLSLLTESQLGTSDTSADTDGDGYTDSQEVASGYDPLK